MKANKEILVCDKCLRASCWYDIFPCNENIEAGLCVMTVGDLSKLRLEDSDYWSDKMFARVYGTTTPHLTARRITLKDAKTRCNPCCGRYYWCADGGSLMTVREFHNALRILLNIDAHEFLRATTGKDEPPSYQHDDWQDWADFRDHPYRWFIKAPDSKAKAIWALVEARQPHVHVRDTSRSTDACAKCGRDLRDRIHERITNPIFIYGH